jgi:hypothetical protein
MKLYSLIFCTLCSLAAFSQPVIFDQTIPEKDVPATSRLSDGMRQNYAVTRYVKQSAFFSEGDFYVVVTPSVVLKSKYIKTHRYPTGSMSYEGKLDGDLRGEITLSKYNDRVAGMILLEDGRKFLIDQTGPALFAISQSKEDIFIQREAAAPDNIEIGSNGISDGIMAASICDITGTCANPSVIDLMIVYTPLASSSWGGDANTVANLTQAVTNMNTAMTNSGVTNVTFRLVHTRKVNYTESGSFSTDLSRLAGTTDGFMDSVHIYRNQYGADMVSLIIGTPTSSCGIGYLNTSNLTYSAGNAFNVSLYSCVVGNYTMSHEFGHNMGLRHDWYVDASTSPCSHHHGYSNQNAISQGTASPTSARWRTIMAYNDQCASVGFNCTRLNRWSNPNLTYNGDPTGIAIGSTNPSDEAYAFYRMACQVAAFRPEAASCATPTGLNAGSITGTGAVLSWSAVTDATSYAVDYKLSSSSTWISAATSNAGLSLTLSGLNGSSTYDWRVKANCSAGGSAYAQAQFNTSSLCTVPTGLATQNITTNSATLSWNSAADATSYQVEYKTSSATSWTTLSTNETNTSYALTGLSAGTSYNWRIASNCLAGTGNFASANFTTTAAVVCNDAYESNNTSKNAKTIALATDINASIGSSGDIDWFRFTSPNTTATNVRVILNSLPANYNIYLYDKNLVLLDSSANSGTTADTVIFNTLVKRATYFIQVRGVNGAFSSSNCYKIRAESSALTYSDAMDEVTQEKASDITPSHETIRWKLYPVPVKDKINILMTAEQAGTAVIELHDLTGRLLQSQTMEVRSGTGTYSLGSGNLRSGIYILKLNLRGKVLTQKVIVENQ